MDGKLSSPDPTVDSDSAIVWDDIPNERDVDPATVAKRRQKNKLARKARKKNRGKR